nr:uncharacterized protein LOC101474011 [Maylandia zebra]
MIDREVALEALGVICNAKVTSVQKLNSGARSVAFQGLASSSSAAPTLSANQLISAVLGGDQTCPLSGNNFARIQSVLQGGKLSESFTSLTFDERTRGGETYIIDQDEFFDRKFDFDFTGLRDTETYCRGGEVYERPCGWQRFAIKVLDKYDGNAWLGTQYRSTQSVPGEWPVSYHGTSKEGAEGIIEGFYKPGPGQVYGRGIYSTPYINEAIHYSRIFTSAHNGKKYRVILQNRINPTYREKHYDSKYWLVRISAGLPVEKEEEMVKRAIRPYGLLLKEV